MAIVHSHSHSIVPLSISVQHRLRAVLHMAGFIGPEAPLFEIRDAGGPATDLLIRSPELGRALAKSLAGSNIVVMRGHGSTVTAPSLPLVVYRAVYAELNARYQCEAMRHGPITPLPPRRPPPVSPRSKGRFIGRGSCGPVKPPSAAVFPVRR